MIPLNKLVENPRNPNKHPDKQIEMLAKIIDYQGQRSPIIVSNLSGFLVRGHGRLAALKRLGWTEAAVDFQDYESEAQEFADMIADNKSSELAEHDDELMAKGIIDLELEDTDLELLGLADFQISEEQEDSQDEDKAENTKEIQCPHCKKVFEAGRTDTK